MKKKELLGGFKKQIDEFARFQDFMAKAEAQKEKFASHVVEKVLADYKAKAKLLLEDILPLMAEVEALKEKATSERMEIQESGEASTYHLQELELRLVIGELTQEEFDTQAVEFQTTAGSVKDSLKKLDKEITSIQKELERWHGLMTSSNILEETLNAEAGADADADQDAVQLEAVDEDVSVELDAKLPDGEVAVEMVNGGKPVLILGEGSQDEKIFDFASEKFIIGRGRDNDMQIKNDSKVSRYHCEVYKKGDAYEIKDNKSANGTLVNGELITTQQLGGGEEIIIGETFVRFKLLPA
jgi:hypothetical protein